MKAKDLIAKSDDFKSGYFDGLNEAECHAIGFYPDIREVDSLAYMDYESGYQVGFKDATHPTHQPKTNK